MKKIYRYLVLMLPILLVSCHSSGPGCTDPRANNLDLSATENDGSCTYDPVWVNPYRSWELSNQISETSGLILWEGRLWTHNDNADTRLYGLDTVTAAIAGEYLLEGVENTDWEEIAQDKRYIYIGDFGNNGSGNRTDLHILRVEKGSLKEGNPSIDTIWFTYSDQHDLSPEKPNQTEFDCEAFVVFSDSIYLFTKQWITGHSTLYALSKAPGNHVAQKISSYDVQGLITGATGLEKENLMVLCGYTGMLQPFLYLLYDYDGSDFFSGHKRRVNILLLFHQVEGITTTDGLTYYLSNEYYNLSTEGSFPQKLHLLDLSEYLEENINP